MIFASVAYTLPRCVSEIIIANATIIPIISVLPEFCISPGLSVTNVTVNTLINNSSFNKDCYLSNYQIELIETQKNNTQH